MPCQRAQGPFLHMKGRLYALCVRNTLLYASKTLAVMGDAKGLVYAKIKMLRQTCNATKRGKPMS